MMPIVYVRYGELKKHTFVSLNQTLQRNKNVYFLGSQDPQIEGVKFFDIRDHEVDTAVFKEKYLHLSTNRYDFEVYCIARWFSLLSLVTDLQFDHFYYCDDDVFNFCELEDVYRLYDNYDASLLFSENLDIASACCSFWKAEALKDFCEFVLSEYTYNLEKYLGIWNRISAHHERGGVSDMNLLYFFSLGRNVGSLTKLTDEGCFDMNPLIPQNELIDEYEMERPYLLRARIKKMRYEGGNAFAFSKQRKDPVRIFAAPEYAKFEVIKSKRSIFRKAVSRLFD